MLKCSRCRHIFPAERTQRAAPPPPGPEKAPAAADRDLDLAYDDATWDGEQTELVSTADEEEDFSLGTTDEAPGTTRQTEAPRREPRLLSEADAPEIGAGGRPRRTIDAPPAKPASPPQQFRFDEEDFEGGAEVAPPTRRAAVRNTWAEHDEEQREEERDDEEVEGEDDDGGEDDEVKRGRGWAVPLVMFFSVVVAGYFLLARELISDRAFAEEFVARLPMVGSSLAADRLLFRKVALADIEGAFVRVKQGRDVFVISGTALNTASRPLRNIRIEGTLLDGEQALQQETITCGGMDARRLLQGLSLREVEMLGKVEPSRKFHLDPGETTTFAIVFTNPPPGAKDFSARVASAQR